MVSLGPMPTSKEFPESAVAYSRTNAVFVIKASQVQIPALPSSLEGPPTTRLTLLSLSFLKPEMQVTTATLRERALCEPHCAEHMQRIIILGMHR